MTPGPPPSKVSLSTSFPPSQGWVLHSIVAQLQPERSLPRALTTPTARDPHLCENVLNSARSSHRSLPHETTRCW